MPYQRWNEEHDGVSNQSVSGPKIYPEFHRKGFVSCLWHFDQDIRYSREGVRWNMINHPLHFFNHEGSGYPGPHDRALFDGYEQCVQSMNSLLNGRSEADLHKRLSFRPIKTGADYYLVALLAWTAITSWFWLRKRKPLVTLNEAEPV